MDMMYLMPDLDDPLSQGDIIEDCPVFGLEVSQSEPDLQAEPARWTERVIVLTQACDLAHAKATKVLVALLHPAQLLADRGVLKPPAIRDQVRRGLVYGWYFLPAAPRPIPLPESIVDLHDLHTVPRAVLNHLIDKQKRVCRMLPPYREHLAQHFAVTYMRIGLPEPYATET
jgi:hypothetical protein